MMTKQTRNVQSPTPIVPVLDWVPGDITVKVTGTPGQTLPWGIPGGGGVCWGGGVSVRHYAPTFYTFIDKAPTVFVSVNVEVVTGVYLLQTSISQDKDTG